MKLNLAIFCFSILFLLTKAQKPLIKHEADEWTVGSIASQKNIFNHPLTDNYAEMLQNKEKKMITLGLNNSGLVDLNSTVVISDDTRYKADDGVTGKISEDTSLGKNELTQYYQEMLSNRNKKILTMQVNNTAFYDPDNQVLVKNTGEMPAIDPLDNYYVDKIKGKYDETPELVKAPKLKKGKNAQTLILSKK